ncbi:MAG: hypothetical protein Q9166_002000 [cf. Caloplaca sp. 2 TL-2023]
MAEMKCEPGAESNQFSQVKCTLMAGLDDLLEHEAVDTADIKRSLQDTISVTTVQPASKNPELEQIDQNEGPSSNKSEVPPEVTISDPLKWFGILVPPALRTSQSSFKHAVTETIPLLANLSNEMKSMEIEIRRMRKKIRRTG